MYKWDVMFLMKNGATVNGIYMGPETTSNDVATKMLIGDVNSFVGISALTNQTALFVRYGDIQACYISPWRENNNG